MSCRGEGGAAGCGWGRGEDDIETLVEAVKSGKCPIMLSASILAVDQSD